MSSRSYIMDGFGFDPTTTDETLCAFILSHKSTVEALAEDSYCYYGDLLEYVESGKTDISDEFSDMECIHSGNRGVSSVVAAVMSAETELYFEYINAQEDCFGSDCIMLSKGMPWDFSEKARSLKQEDLVSIMKKYMVELGIEGDPDFCEVEHWG